MWLLSIVEHFDVLADVAPGFLPGDTTDLMSASFPAAIGLTRALQAIKPATHQFSIAYSALRFIDPHCRRDVVTLDASKVGRKGD